MLRTRTVSGRPPASSASRGARRPAARPCSLAMAPARQRLFDRGHALSLGGTRLPPKASAHRPALVPCLGTSTECSMQSALCGEPYPLPERPVPCPATCHPPQGGVDLGRIASLEKDHKPVDTARRGDAVAMKIEVRSWFCGCCVRSCAAGLCAAGAPRWALPCPLCVDFQAALAAAGCAPCACHAAELLQRRAGYAAGGGLPGCGLI